MASVLQREARKVSICIMNANVKKSCVPKGKHPEDGIRIQNDLKKLENWAKAIGIHFVRDKT